MSGRTYTTGRFASRTSVSVRTLRYYDAVGLLTPAARTEAGYRLYTDDDLVRLQQVLALKFLGFSLEEIKTYLATGPVGLREALAAQRAMVRERRAQLDAVDRALGETERLLATDGCAWAPVVKAIEVIQMERRDDWHEKYFTPEQRETLDKLTGESYSDEARERLAELHPNPWTEEDQRRIDARYAALWDGVRRLSAAGADPGAPEAQALAAESIALLEAFTGGAPEVEEGLATLWGKVDALPEAERPLPRWLTDEEEAFLERAKAIYRERRD